VSELDDLKLGLLGLGPIKNTLIYEDPITKEHSVRYVTPEFWSLAAEYLDEHQIN
jgi:hypothetical protein